MSLRLSGDVFGVGFVFRGGARKGRRSQGSPGTRKGQKSCATADVEVITGFLGPGGVGGETIAGQRTC